MKFRETESINDFIITSLTNGQTTRELRLTNEELTYVTETYPYAEIEQLSLEQQSQKNWYKINIKPQLTKTEVV